MKKERLLSRTALLAMQFRLFFSVLLILIVTQSTGQTNYNLTAAISSSPQFRAFTTYRDYPMANYTGLTDITLPFFPLTQRKHSLPITMRYHAQKDISNSGQSLTDVTIEIQNNFWKDVDIWLYNLSLDTFYYLNISRYRSEMLTIPEGNYDVDLWPNDGDSGYHSYTAGCGNYGGGVSVFKFEGIYLGAGCNFITID